MAPPVEAAPTDPDVVFAIGSEVLLEGLVNKPQLNGRFGEIVSVLSNGRFGVRLWESTGSLTEPPLSISHTKLVHRLGSKLNICTGCRNSFGSSCLMKCRNCRRAEYCSKECQTANWPEHKKICKVLRISRTEKDDDLPSIQDINDRIKARVARATRHTQTSNHAAAEQEFRQLIDECPPDHHEHVYFSLLANTLYRQSRLDDALLVYKRALELPLSVVETSSAYSKTWFMIGCALQAKNDYEGALDAYKSALEIDPENAMAAEGQLLLAGVMEDRLQH